MADVNLKKIGDLKDEKQEGGSKIPPQLQVIMTALGKYEHGVLRSKLAAEVKDDLKTRQDPERVIAFYQKRMVTEGAVEVTKIGGTTTKKEDGGEVAAEGKTKAPGKTKAKPAAQSDSVAA